MSGAFILLLAFTVAVQVPKTFERFAHDHELRMTAEPLTIAPRDVLAPIEGVEQHFLVSLSRAGTRGEPVRMVFVTPLSEHGGPSIRDVLWWVAGDAWAVERADRNADLWAATYGYPTASAAASWLFDQALRQRNALATLLGDDNMQRLLTLYETEIGDSWTR